MRYELRDMYDERFISDTEAKGNIIYDEHMIRYELAKGFVQGKTVLDIACGSGYGSNILAKAGAEKVTGMDVDEDALDGARKKFISDNLEFKKGNGLDLGEYGFDVVVSFETIEHLQEGEKFLSELAKAVKDDGTVIISTPNKEVFLEKNPYHVREYTKEEFENLLKKYFSDFKIIEQHNGMASFLKIGENGFRVIFSNQSKPAYFVAICSKKGSPELPEESFFSINEAALDNLYNNPGMRMVNAVYTLLVMIPGMRTLISMIKK